MFQLGHFDVERNLEATFLVPHYNVQVPVRTTGEAVLSATGVCTTICLAHCADVINCTVMKADRDSPDSSYLSCRHWHRYVKVND